MCYTSASSLHKHKPCLAYDASIMKFLIIIVPFILVWIRSSSATIQMTMFNSYGGENVAMIEDGKAQLMNSSKVRSVVQCGIMCNTFSCHGFNVIQEKNSRTCQLFKFNGNNFACSLRTKANSRFYQVS